MWPNLSGGALNRILNGEDVSMPVFQILGCKRVPNIRDECYRLLISDGVTEWNFSVLDAELNPMVANKELEKFTIVRVDKYVCNQNLSDHKIIILLNLVVLAAGNEVKEKLGNLINSPAAASAEPATNDRANQPSTYQAPQIMWPNLSNGAINRILNGEVLSMPVLQILDCKRNPNVRAERYWLLISDGVTEWKFSVLDAELNPIVANKELEKFTIVQVDKCVCNQYLSGHTIIVFLNLTVLAAGNEVKEKLGNPINSLTTSNSLAAASAEPAANDRANQLRTYQAPQIMRSSLSNGAIKRILKGEDVSMPVLQILNCEKVTDMVDEYYSLLISDGVTLHRYCTLSPQLNHMVANEELKTFTIVRVDKHALLHGNMVILLNVIVLAPGNEVKETLGYPRIPALEKPAINDRAHLPRRNQESQITLPSLFAGAISRILNGEDVSTPVLQILECRKIETSCYDMYRLEISDGNTSDPFALLDDPLVHMAANKELERFTIVRVDKYVCNQVSAGHKVITLMNVTVLVAGNKVNVKLGDPIDSSDTSYPARGMVRVGRNIEDLCALQALTPQDIQTLQALTMQDLQTLRIGSDKKDLQVQTVPVDPATKDRAHQHLKTDRGCDYCHHCRTRRRQRQ